MPQRERLFRRLSLAVLAVAGPSLAAFLLLAAGGWLELLPALVAALGVLGALALLLRRQIAHLLEVAHYLKRLAADGAGTAAKAPPMPRAPDPAALVPELGQAVAEAARAWSRRRRELEAVVHANETIFASLPDPLILLDAERRVLRANQAAEALLGSGLAGRDLLELLRNPELLGLADRAAGGRGGVAEFVLLVPVERTLSARIEPLPTRAADGTVAVLTLHDLTAIKRVDRMRADFVANVSHELRTPLSTLIGFIETLSGPARDDPDATARFLGIMHEQASRMARLVADLLSLSRIELNEHSPPTGAVDLARTLRAVVDTLQFKAADKGMTIALGAPPPPAAGVRRDSHALDLLPPVVGDADELAQVFQNLIDNAIKYGRAGSTIRVAGWVTAAAPAPGPAERERPAMRRFAGDAVAIAVSDEGEGIPREHLPRLTERFYRVDTARSRDLGGTGLGLAIVKHIVNRHRGRLDIDSVLGQGSTFTIYLPRADTRPSAG